MALWKNWKRGRCGSLPKLDRRTAWQEVARAVGGTFEQGKRPSADRVTIAHGPWTITLNTYRVQTGEATITYTRATTLFIGQSDPRLWCGSEISSIRSWRMSASGAWFRVTVPSPHVMS